MSAETGAVAHNATERARQCYALGRFAEALPLLETCVQTHPNYADLWHMLGICEHHTNQLSQAERAFRRALAINPHYTEAALSLTVLLNDTGRYQAARELYRETLKLTSTVPGHMDPLAMGKIANMHRDLADAYAEAHRPEEARSEYQRALNLRPGFVDIRLALANLLFEQKLIDEAIGELRQCVTDRPEFLPAHLRLAAVLMHAKRIDDAVVIYDKLLARDPHLAEAQRGLRLARAARDALKEQRP